jgi:glyoxylase-like metal-dependent hydrolase (beta-lactamase superfamily II)
MEGVTQVADDLYYLQHQMRPGWFCGISVLVGKNSLGLVDTGLENTPEEYLLPFLKQLGREPAEITTVYNTHGDGDHVEGNLAIKKICNPTIYCHEEEASVIENVDKTVTEGDIIVLGDRTFTVVHVPGHRVGNTCLFDKDSSLMIVGDTIVGTRTELIRIGKEPYISSLRKIQSMSPKTVLMSHPFEPAGKILLKGAEISDMIEASVKIAKDMP